MCGSAAGMDLNFGFDLGDMPMACLSPTAFPKPRFGGFGGGFQGGFGGGFGGGSTVMFSSSFSSSSGGKTTKTAGWPMTCRLRKGGLRGDALRERPQGDEDG